MMQKPWIPAALVGVLALSLAGCGAKHTVGDKVVYDPEAEEESASEAKPSSPGGGDDAAQGTMEPTQPAQEKAQFLEAKGTSYGGEDWVAEIKGEDGDLWLLSPFDEATTYAAVRAATFLQGLRMKEEHFDQRRFTTTLGYRAWHPESEGGLALTMKVLTKGFGKDARYRFRVAVDPRDGGSRVDVAQHREVMEEEPQQDVGDWVEADEPDPAITRKYLEGVQRAIGE